MVKEHDGENYQQLYPQGFLSGKKPYSMSNSVYKAIYINILKYNTEGGYFSSR